MSSFALVAALVALVGCRKDPTPPPQPAAQSPQSPPGIQNIAPQNIAVATKPPDTLPSPELVKDREAFLADAMAFLKMSREEVLDRTTVHNTGMKDEWAQWEAKGPMTDARIKEFYKQTRNYIFDLGGWHLWDPNKYASDVQLVEDARRANIKNILDFGGGVGFNSLLFAKAGFDVTLADLDSVTLKFAMFRAECRHGRRKS